MDQIKGALTSKIGPFPGWAWAGIVAVGAFLLWPTISAGLGSVSSSSGAGTGSSGGTDGGGTTGDPGGSGPPPPVPTPLPPPPAPNAYGVNPDLWKSWTEHQREYWKLHHKIPPAAGGPSIGSASADPLGYFHPQMKRPPRYPQLIRAIGGPAAHSANVARAAAQSGSHAARIQALNPHYTGLIRIA